MKECEEGSQGTRGYIYFNEYVRTISNRLSNDVSASTWKWF